MAHDHHQHIDPEAGDFRVALAIAVNLVLTVAQVIGGILSGSLALIADALHNFSDAIALIIAFTARKIARRPADHSMTFGYGRVEVVAALINYTTLAVLGIYLVYEGVMRLIDPQPVAGWMVVIIAVVAVVVDLATAALTWSMSKDSVNIRAAFLHNMADAAGSVAVIVAGVAILLWDMTWVDPAVTLLIAGYILWQVAREIGPVVRILMLGSPKGIAISDVLAQLGAEPGVSDIHHAHLWMVQEHEAALQAHIVVDAGQWRQADAIKARLKSIARDGFGISHTTFEMECSQHACDAPATVGG
jgi:cobalt-zinc-cadmium efflux system protein